MLGRREKSGVRGINVGEEQAMYVGSEGGGRTEGTAGKSMRGRRESGADRAREERVTLVRVRQEHQLVTDAYSYPSHCSIFLFPKFS